jgi:hypothetical protein
MRAPARYSQASTGQYPDGLAYDPRRTGDRRGVVAPRRVDLRRGTGLEQADALWPDGFPFVAYAAFAEHRPDDATLDTLAAAPDPGSQAVAVATYLPTAPRRRARARGRGLRLAGE